MIRPNIDPRDLHGVFYENGEKANQLYAISEARIRVDHFCDADLRSLTCLTKFYLYGGTVSVKLPTSLVRLELHNHSKAENIDQLTQLTYYKMENKMIIGEDDVKNPANTPCQKADEDKEKEEQKWSYDRTNSCNDDDYVRAMREEQGPIDLQPNW
ncbi:hypothetical protein EIN_263440 [Entamoeba invadens IP1]|uniref:Uncharacterized protein n=1 Tax=Entamoeba invadens IP1 TaxID=370355 RepID=L7FNC3_ENTIV|nr:hypothetical protein EIN_263440 [Entamoeba invadens IP1]ELP92960.1 hypothetical protein EIN_263440 [Entamoeba invadens IP1]|eukprot:XP_004259731.1 hypothetical protein EIN_263440 [Entamoeba invadens IP1]